MNDILGAPAPPRATAQPKPAEKTPVPWPKVVIAALLWGWGGAALLGLILGGLMHVVIQETGGVTGLTAGANFGAMLGFLLGSVYGVVSTLGLEIGKASLMGMAIGAADTTIHYYGESMFIAPPDYAAYLYTLMGCGAGATAGALSVIFRNYRENA